MWCVWYLNLLVSVKKTWLIWINEHTARLWTAKINENTKKQYIESLIGLEVVAASQLHVFQQTGALLNPESLFA